MDERLQRLITFCLTENIPLSYINAPDLNQVLVNMERNKIIRRNYALNMMELIPHEFSKNESLSRFLLSTQFDRFCKAWVKKWNEAQHKYSVKNIVGYYIHGNSVACKERLTEYFRNWDIMFEPTDVKTIMETINKATDLYLSSQSNQAWKATHKNVNFISNQDGSPLEAAINAMDKQTKYVDHIGF